MELNTQALIDRKAIMKDHSTLLKHIANDEQVKATGVIASYRGYDNDVLVEYIKEFGYEIMNEYIMKLGAETNATSSENKRLAEIRRMDDLKKQYYANLESSDDEDTLEFNMEGIA